MRYLIDILIGGIAGAGVYQILRKRDLENFRKRTDELVEEYEDKLKNVRSEASDDSMSEDNIFEDKDKGADEKAVEVHQEPQKGINEKRFNYYSDISKNDYKIRTQNNLFENYMAEREHPTEDDDEVEGAEDIDESEESDRNEYDELVEEMSHRIPEESYLFYDEAYEGVLGQGVHLILEEYIDDIENSDECEDLFYYTKDRLLVDSSDYLVSSDDTIGNALYCADIGNDFMVFSDKSGMYYHVRVVDGKFMGILHEDNDDMLKREAIKRKKREREEE